ncbi:MAG: ABC transporter substrate-binding protein, partial [Erysipelotrichaceae bacterium]|nr:ABC transporter substrate-binding protein [Erysipelotrichaceae bacterium]
PETKTVGILYCSAEANSIYQVKKVTEYLEAKGITVKAAPFADSNDIASTLEDLADQIDVLYIPTDNQAASCAETIANIILPKKIPAITGEEGPCAICGVASLTISYYDLGVETGKMAAKILKGEAKIEEMEIQYFPNPVKKFNKEIAEQLGVNIPEDYIAIE